MKKNIALLLALLLAVGLTACGISDDDAATTRTTTGSASATTSAESTTTTIPQGTESGVSTETSVEVPTTEATASGSTAPTQPSVTTTTTTTTTTSPAPTGATVPIGTKPTSTTQAPTTTTTTGGKPSTGGSSTATTTTPTTTTTTVKPTEPPVQGPYIVLPAIGSDIDVTRKKDRIRVSDVAAWFNEDGSIGVQLTFKNYTSNWITEETDYVEYTCYDKNGNKVQGPTKIMIGCIDTKRNPVKDFTFDVPAATAEVRLTKSKITYWTEWA